MSNGDVNAAIYLHQVTGDLEPVVRAAMSSGTLTDQMVGEQINLQPIDKSRVMRNSSNL